MRIHPIKLFLILAFIGTTLAVLQGCNGKNNIENNIEKAQIIQSINPYIYVLEFDHNGRLASHQEVARAIREINNDNDIDGAIVLSLGWGHNRDDIVSDYYFLLNKYINWKNDYIKLNNLKISKNKKAVFLISWESSLTGFGHFFGDLLPFSNGFANYFSAPFQPFTYWSKARQADKIGFGDLKYAMRTIVNGLSNKNRPLNIYVVAHSFGSRIVTGMLNSSENQEDDIPFNNIKGGLLIQPALSNFELHNLGAKPNNNNTIEPSSQSS